MDRNTTTIAAINDMMAIKRNIITALKSMKLELDNPHLQKDHDANGVSELMYQISRDVEATREYISQARCKEVNDDCYDSEGLCPDCWEENHASMAYKVLTGEFHCDACDKKFLTVHDVDVPF